MGEVLIQSLLKSMRNECVIRHTSEYTIFAGSRKPTKKVCDEMKEEKRKTINA